MRTGLFSLGCHVKRHRSVIKQREFRVSYIIPRLETLRSGTTILVFHHIKGMSIIPPCVNPSVGEPTSVLR